MPRQFHDIVPPQKRTIRNIPKAGARGKPLRRTPPREPRAEPSFRGGNGGRSSWQPSWGGGIHTTFYVKWGIALALLLIVFFLIFSFLFSGSTVTLVPKQQETVVDTVFEVFREPTAGALSYQLMTAEKTGSEIVPATERREVEERASGTIVVFNNYDGATQRLITNTRFETPDGLIYRINEPVVVPGQTTREDGTAVPGSIEVTVYADEPGERYNIGLSDFTIPGFAGSPRFEGFFARSKTAMEGGFIGEKLVVSPDILVETKERIKETLRETLMAESFAQKSDGHLLFSDGIFIEFSELPEIERDGGVEVRIAGTLRGVLFDEQEFGQYVAAWTLAGYDEEPVIVLNVDDLSFTVSDKDIVRPWEDNSFTFSLSGPARIVWVNDEDALATDLAGRSKDALPTILEGYPGILRAEVTLRPFWQGTFPDNPEEITVRQKLDE